MYYSAVALLALAVNLILNRKSIMNVFAKTDAQDAEQFRISYEVCRWHHERNDGNGYPDGLKGDEIPISAQIVSIVDVYDALVSERTYKKAYDYDTAFKMIMNNECGEFSPKILKCLEVSKRLLELFADSNA